MLLMSGDIFVIDIEMFQQPLDLHFLEDNPNTAHNTSPISNHMIPSTKDHIPPRCSHIPRKSIQLQIMLNRIILDLLSYYLTLNWQSPRRIDDHRESLCS